MKLIDLSEGMTIETMFRKLLIELTKHTDHLEKKNSKFYVLDMHEKGFRGIWTVKVALIDQVIHITMVYPDDIGNGKPIEVLDAIVHELDPEVESAMSSDHRIYSLRADR